MLSISRRALLRVPRQGTVWKRPAQRNSHSNSEVRKPPGSAKDEDDFRPPWVYALSRFGSVAVIPVIGLYAVFVYDWGDHDHVFMPPRRLFARVKQSFFTLSPAEEQMLKGPSSVEQRAPRILPAPPLPPVDDKPSF
ncbi:hypothetical protein FA15DRAFT_665722 [Coprinopsis marcescibilis]|uniref:Uncharacterized protein n=1 Tax=Coprinopsis marcescibilis TaxID=230819 RepID=A0A5C3L5Z3_COPMA|nr:hypothetical protein FA15DRAFT_665722 [Coprinopsis marcescibilis]